MTVVRIPCDDSKAYEEVTVDFDMGHGDQLMEGLRPFFLIFDHTFNMEALQKTLKGSTATRTWRCGVCFEQNK